MKKIISILVALGVILGLTAFAAPVAAIDCPDDCTPPDILDTLMPSPPDFCAGDISHYQIGDWHHVGGVGLTLPVTLIPGTDSLSVTFPVGTDLSSVVNTGIYVCYDDAGTPRWAFVTDATKFTVTDNYLEFVVPVAFATLSSTGTLVAGQDIDIEVWNVVNGPAGDVCLYVDYKLACCDPVDFDCVEYTVNPNVCELDIVFDFSPTYHGLAEGFIPPFKACGQEWEGCGHYEYGHEEACGWVTEFDLIITPVVPGCHHPCDVAKLYFVVTKCPEGETITFDDGTVNPTWELDEDDIDKEKVIDASVALPEPCNDVVVYDEMWIHFSSPGKYEICFYLYCPAIECGPEGGLVAEKCMPCSVYQWKDAVRIPLYRKWNLISLPLVPLVDPPIDEMLEAYPLKNDVKSIWYYDRCEDYPTGQWYVWPTPTGTQEALTDLVDGKSYWVRIKYDDAHPAGTAAGGLWTWGTPQPTPPTSPSAYAVCEGWNMVGLTGHELAGWWFGGTQILDEDYLWNWFDDSMPEYGGIYGWDPNGYTAAGPQAWWSVTPVGNLLPQYYTGEGYWIAFEHNGMIYPP